MAARTIAVRSVRDGSILQLGNDTRCVPLRAPESARVVEIMSVERGQDDLACVCYDDGQGGIAVFATRELRLAECQAGVLVVVPSRGASTSCWMVVRVGGEASAAADLG